MISPIVFNQNNLILDADFGLIKQPRELDETLASRAGIVEHGIFISLTTDLIIAEQTGIRHLQKHNDQMVEIESKNFH